MTSEKPITSSPLVGNVATLMAGGAVGQMVSLAASPAVAAYYGPEAFGQASIFLAIVSVVTTVASLRYEQAVVIAESDGAAISIVRLALAVLGVTVALSSMTIAVTGWFLPGLGGLGPWLWCVPAAVALAALPQVLISWHLRRRGFRAISTSSALTPTFTAGSRIGLGWLGLHSFSGLIIGQLVGWAVQSATLLRGEGRPLLRRLRHRTGETSLGTIAREYRDFPLLSAPTGLINSFSQYALNIFMMALLFTGEAVGLFAWADRILRQPVVLVNTAVRRVLLQRAAELREQPDAFRILYLRATGALLLLGVGPMLLLELYSEPVFAWIFGEEWRASGPYAAALAPWLVALAAVPPAHVACIVGRRQGTWLGLQVVLALMRALVFGAAWMWGWSALETIEILGWTNFAAALAIMIICYKLIPPTALTLPEDPFS